ncbi:MAG TPA: hypothetical protein VKP30_25695 [Polyangiaceae bacterium]|nr:hypothetical protein [Polyangiaceae bacterium]
MTIADTLEVRARDSSLADSFRASTDSEARASSEGNSLMQRRTWRVADAAARAVLAAGVDTARHEPGPRGAGTVASREDPSTNPPMVGTSVPQPSALDVDGIPSYVFKPALIHLTGIAIRRAEHCDPRGHAVGTARVLITFAPNGTVSHVKLEGEPIAGAPVSRCILHHARSIRIAKFNGNAFTYATQITMR